MENKEVEQMLEQLKVEYALLEGKVYYQNKDVEKLLEDNQILTKQVHQLKQQLKAKNKALDKACGKLSDEVYACSIDGYLDVERWKEWCEDE